MKWLGARATILRHDQSIPRRSVYSPAMHAVVVAHGDAGDLPWLRSQLAAADLIIAADGGAAALQRTGVSPHVLVGDLDSISPAVRLLLAENGCEVIAHPPEKDQTDTELALLLACERGATSITLAGGFGGARLDHALANILLLALPELAGRDVRLADPAHTVFLLRGPDRRFVSGQPGDLVTLLPLADGASGVVTDGLRYPLANETLVFGRSRGVSNELVGSSAVVRVETGSLLIVLHRAGSGPGGSSRGEATVP